MRSSRSSGEARKKQGATISYTLFTLAFRQEPDQLVLAFFAQGKGEVLNKRYTFLELFELTTFSSILNSQRFSKGSKKQLLQQKL